MTDDKKPRTIRVKFILNWKKDDSGGRRAKARLICQGFRDPDALNGSLTTASPTLTRLSRNMVMSISAMLDYIPFTAGITTAFLQGKKYDPNSSRVIWIKLPRDAEQILGLQGDHGQVMKLTKPMYGLVDAPKAWFDEAVTRIMDLGKGSIVQHPLDSCLFLKFDRPIQLGIEDQEEPQLLAIFDIHVDDLFGAYDQKNPLALDFVADLQKIFKFREWHEGSTKDELTYCGTQICKPLRDIGESIKGTTSRSRSPSRSPGPTRDRGGENCFERIAWSPAVACYADLSSPAICSEPYGWLCDRCHNQTFGKCQQGLTIRQSQR